MATECQAWRHAPSVSALRVRVGVREAEAGGWIPEFTAFLIYRGSSRAGATQRNRNGFINFLFISG